MIKRFQAERFVVAIKTPQHQAKVFQVIFSRSDGSMFVNFPYFLNSHGLATIATVPANTTFPAEISLVSAGKVTSHLVKYSHHRDGRVHFSQHGKVKTEVIKQAVPLDKVDGHIFTVQIQGVHGFKTLTPKDMQASDVQKKLIGFEFDSDELSAVKIVGRWFSKQSLLERIEGNVVGPKIVGENTKGERVVGFALGPTPKSPLEDYTLYLSCEVIPEFSKNETELTFTGGFDSVEIVNNHAVDTSFLALSYPNSDYDNLKAKLGSIDLVTSRQLGSGKN